MCSVWMYLCRTYIDHTSALHFKFCTQVLLRGARDLPSVHHAISKFALPRVCSSVMRTFSTHAACELYVGRSIRLKHACATGSESTGWPASNTNFIIGPATAGHRANAISHQSVNHQLPCALIRGEIGGNTRDGVTAPLAKE